MVTTVLTDGKGRRRSRTQRIGKGVRQRVATYDAVAAALEDLERPCRVTVHCNQERVARRINHEPVSQAHQVSAVFLQGDDLGDAGRRAYRAGTLVLDAAPVSTSAPNAE